MDVSERGRGLSTPEVARRLGKHRTWVQRAIGRGELPAYRLGGRDYTIFEADLQQFIAARRVQVQAGGAA